MPDNVALLGVALLMLLYPTWTLRSSVPAPGFRWVAPVTWVATALCVAGLTLLYFN